MTSRVSRSTRCTPGCLASARDSSTTYFTCVRFGVQTPLQRGLSLWQALHARAAARLPSRVGVAPQLHLMAAHEAVQADEHHVKALAVAHNVRLRCRRHSKVTKVSRNIKDSRRRALHGSFARRAPCGSGARRGEASGARRTPERKPA